MKTAVFTTARLTVRPARPTTEDSAFLYRLWTTAAVMRPVGFPEGLRTTPEEILLAVQGYRNPPFDIPLLVELAATERLIGQCKLGTPDSEGVAGTDVKLLPEFWGQGFGSELKRALVSYLFSHTDCLAVQATPNRDNIASQRMQEAAGGRRVGEGVHRFPEHMREYTTDVAFYVYHIRRQEWEKEGEDLASCCVHTTAWNRH
ncbi:GNAT family N-acetyltransferase [Candidatus Fermentibacteria bacterium]|nr:GNAT family N-acetyltransferase [Candidatus Fermentibacteria bacterium]